MGYYLGKNTTVDRLIICSTPPTSCDTGIEAFRRGLGRNRSIRKLSFSDNNQLDGQIFHMLDLFLKNNPNLTEIEVNNCDLWPEGIRQLSLALRGCNKSLRNVRFDYNNLGGGQLVDIIVSLGMHPQLKHLDLVSMEIDRNECTALATLLRKTTKQLQILDLYGNNVDNDGIEVLTHGISGSQLVKLVLSCDRSITIRGWKTLSTLLQMPDSNLEEIDLSLNNTSNEAILAFANSLKGNCKLKMLDLSYCNDITEGGWAPFSKLLCDPSSINKTYLSNHTLEDLGATHLMPFVVQSYLILNRNNEDKGQVAMIKILQHHSHFNVQPFFEWEFRVLPLMITWLEKASTCTSIFGEEIKRTKLSITYDFVREFPMLYIEPVTRKEIEDCSALENELQGVQSQQAKLEEVLQRKTRALRRLW